MPASQHLQIRAAIAAALLTAQVLPAARIHENRELTLSNGVDSQLHVNFKQSRPREQVVYTSHPREWDSEYELVLLARKTAGEEASDVADLLWVAVYQAVMADTTLGGLSIDLLPGEATVDDAEGDTSLCRLTWSLTVQHRTSNNTLT
jgi:hypothetical protein